MDLNNTEVGNESIKELEPKGKGVLYDGVWALKDIIRRNSDA